MKKKFLALVMAIICTLSMAACGNTDSGNSQNSGSAQESEKGGTDQSTAETTEEPVTITMEMFDRGNMDIMWIDWDAGESILDNKYVNLLKEAALKEINVNIEYVAIPRSEEVTKIQTLMSAQSEPDIFFTYYVDQFLNWVGTGAVADLTDSMETDAGKELSAFLGDNALSYGQVGGRQYSINGLVYNEARLCSFVRKDLLDKVGVELRELDGHYALTAAELEDALVKIKEAGYCEYPYAVVNMFQCLEPVIGAFVKDEDFDSKEKLIQNTEDSFYLLDGTKEAFRFLNRCYNEGLIHPDFPLYNEKNIGEMISAQEAAFWSYSLKWLGKDGAVDLVYQADPNAEVVAVEIIQEDGSHARYYRETPVSAYGMVSSNCENVDAAVKLINWLNTSESAHILTDHGIEGEDFYVDEDGDRIFIADSESEYVGNADMDMWQNNCICKKSDEDIIRIQRKNYEGVWSDKNLQAYEDFYYIATSEGKEYPVIPDKIIASANEWALSLKENADNLVIGSITCTEDKFDEVYDRYLQIYLDEGGSQVAEERLESYKSRE